MRYLMDTCVFSELFKPHPHPVVQAWMDRQLREDVFLSILSVGEIRRGIARLSDLAKASELEELLYQVRDDYEEQMLELTSSTLVRWGWMCGLAEKKRRGTLPVIDSLMAATALEHGLVVATRNVKDFERCGVEVVNPWEG